MAVCTLAKVNGTLVIEERDHVQMRSGGTCERKDTIGGKEASQCSVIWLSKSAPTLLATLVCALAQRGYTPTHTLTQDCSFVSTANTPFDHLTESAIYNSIGEEPLRLPFHLK